MAAPLMRICLKKSLAGKKVLNVGYDDQMKKYRLITILSVTVYQYHDYHTAPVLFKYKKEELEKAKRSMISIIAEKKKIKKPVQVWEGMTVKELASSTSRSINDVTEVLFLNNRSLIYKPNSIISNHSILIDAVKKLGLAPNVVINPKLNLKNEDEDYEIFRQPINTSALIKRRPVVTVMGHVDHGKTTLLDSLRNTAVVDTEFGGITQHIGAFNVTLNTGEKITFLDTPGHAAFSAMRSRGAHVTDIVVLVVAADDGVMEQTVQSIEMAKDANVPIIVAINKIDKSEADIERTYNMLAQYGIHLEVLGGDVQSVNISALKGTNLNQLKDAIMAQAEIMDLKGDPTGFIEGVVIESSTDPGRGKLATALIRRGTLKKGNIIVSGLAWAKVRSMFDHEGKLLKEASLSDAVQIIGWREAPQAGDEILQVDSEKQAQKVLKHRHAKMLEQKSIKDFKAAQAKLGEHLIEYKERLKLKRTLGLRNISQPRKKETEPDDGVPKVNIVIKADVAGSVEAILDTLGTYPSDDKCRLNVVHYGIGPITETDVELAEVFNAIIYCFNIKGSSYTHKNISNKIIIRNHNVIYKLIDDLKEEISKNLPRITVETVIGEADVLQEFEINEKRKKVKVAGCRCKKGELKKMANYKLIRNDEILFTGKLTSMKHMKDEVTSIKNGVECGIRLDNPEISYKPGDVIICFLTRQEQSKLHWNPGF